MGLVSDFLFLGIEVTKEIIQLLLHRDPDIDVNLDGFDFDRLHLHLGTAGETRYGGECGKQGKTIRYFHELLVTGTYPNPHYSQLQAKIQPIPMF